MPSTLEEAFLQKNPKKKLVIGVAIDGSNISDKALATACGFYNAARGDKLVILHVSDSSKTFLPRHLQPKHLESQYVDKAHSLRVCIQPAVYLQCCLSFPAYQFMAYASHTAGPWQFLIIRLYRMYMRAHAAHIHIYTQQLPLPSC
jgi:hypothetical protein